MTTRDQICATLSDILSDGIDIHRCAAAVALGRIAEPATVEALLSALLDEDEDVRSDAAQALADMDDPKTAKPLMENLLGDPAAVVKQVAMKTLTRLRHQDLIPWLRRIIRGRNEEIVWDDDEYYAGGWDDWLDLQVQAIEAVAEFGAEEAVPDIVSALEDEMGQDLSAVGFRALARLGESGASALAGFMETGDGRTRRRAIVHLAASSMPAVVAAVARGLEDSNVEVRLAAADALARRDPNDARLRALFDDGSAEVREAAVRLCGADNAGALMPLLDDKAHRVQRAVLDLIAAEPERFVGDAVETTIRARLRGDAPKTAAVAAAALAAVARETAVDDLAVQVTDRARMEEVRLAALKAIVSLEDEAVGELLSGLVGDESRQIRLEAMAALMRRAGSEAWPNAAGDALLAALRGELVPGPEPVEETGGRAAEDASPTAAEQGEEERDPGDGHGAEADASEENGAVDAPTDDGPSSTLSAILGEDSPHLQVLKNEGSKVELSAKDLEFLGLAQRKLRKRKTSPVPQVAPHQDVRRFAARLLGDLPRGEVAVELAESLALGEDLEVRVNAADSLARIAEHLDVFPPPVQEAVVELLNGKERDLRVLAVRALGFAGDEQATPVISACLKDADSFVRSEAVRALARSGETDKALFYDLLTDPDASVRLAAAHALAARGANGTVDHLTEFAFAFEGYHHREVAEILRDLDPEAASQRFLDVLAEEKRKREWEIAITALGQLNGAAGAST